MTKAILVAQFLRARAWWRLDSAGANARHVARSVVSLIDAAGYVHGLPDDHPDLVALDAAGCFAGGLFDPGPEGWLIVREWQLADQTSAGPADLLAQLARAAGRDGPGQHLATLTHPAPAPAPLVPAPAPAPTAVIVPRQPSPAPAPTAVIVPRQPSPAHDSLPSR